MKRSRVSRMLFVVAAVLAGGGCVLPWVKVPASLGRERIEAAEAILTGARSKLGPRDFLWLDGVQLDSALAEPMRGANVWQLAFAGDGATAYAGGLLARPAEDAGGRLVLAALPVAVMALALLGNRGLARGMPGQLAGAALLLIYALIRWRIAATEGARVVAEIETGMGAWVTALAALLAGLVCMAREVFPKARWL